MGGEVGAALLGAFGRVHVINLTDRADRRREMEGELRRIGLSLTHPGVSVFAATRPAEAGGFPTAGTRGCFESHLAVLARIAAGPEPAGLILEDDADFTPALGPGLAALGEWDMVLGLHSAMAGGWDGRAGAPFVRLMPGEEVVCAHFLAVRREVAAEAVPFLSAIAARPFGHPEGGAMHVDGAWNWFRRARPGLRALAAVPPWAVQRPSRSDIHPPPFRDRQPLLRPLTDLARRARRLWARRQGGGTGPGGPIPG
jgi:glycosyl transferase family 25